MTTVAEAKLRGWQRSVLENHVRSSEKTATWANGIRIGYWFSEILVFSAAVVEFLQTQQVGALMGLAAINFPFLLIAEGTHNIRSTLASIERSNFDRLYPSA